MPPPVTPLTRRHNVKNPLLGRIIQEDMDELSLGPADFKIISSHRKFTPQIPFGTAIKRETSIAPNLNSSAAQTSKKRRFSEIVTADEVDELGDECFGRSTVKRIKQEVDLDNTPMVHRVKAQRKQVRKEYREEARKTGVDLPAHVQPSSVARAGTPLLDLTPNGKPGRSYAATADAHRSAVKESDALLTPTRVKPAAKGLVDSTQGVPLVVKTPGGTYRKCGEGRFRCGRSFCFRCGSKETTTRRIK